MHRVATLVEQRRRVLERAGRVAKAVEKQHRVAPAGRAERDRLGARDDPIDARRETLGYRALDTAREQRAPEQDHREGAGEDGEQQHGRRRVGRGEKLIRGRQPCGHHPPYCHPPHEDARSVGIPRAAKSRGGGYPADPPASPDWRGEQPIPTQNRLLGALHFAHAACTPQLRSRSTRVRSIRCLTSALVA